MTAPITPDERAAMRDTAHFTKATVGLYGQATPTQVEVDYADTVLRLLDALDTAEAEVTRLREEAARPAPVWDEDTVYAEVDREALRRFVDSFCDDEAGEVEHVVSADGTSGFAFTGGNDAHAVLRKAASALWPGESRATVQAEALHDAAAAVTEIDGRRDDAAARWLRARADRLDPKETDRG